MERVIVYIDGFNCYFGLKENKWKCYYWLDYQKLAQKLVSRINVEDKELIATKYFTARISNPDDKRKRQSDYLEVLQTRKSLEIIYGHYRENKFKCSNCDRPNFIPNEKQTDVNIAVQMLSDAYQDKFTTAILIGGDSDLVPPIAAIRNLFPQKRVIACFPPNRSSKQILGVVNGQLHLREADLKNNLLPDRVEKPDGYVIVRPPSWR